MYGIVADVERYPEFVPWCAGLRILGRDSANPDTIFFAETLVGFKAIRERYTSRVTLDPHARRIDVTQTEGPFRQLDNHWRFTPEGVGCRVEFSIAFEFRNRMLGLVANAALGHVMLRMTDAFELRARILSQRP